MILIPPDFGYRGGEGADAYGLVASIKCALESGAPFETRNLCFRVLGQSVVIEGAIEMPGGSEYVRRIAEEIAGPNRIIIRISCPAAKERRDH